MVCLSLAERLKHSITVKVGYVKKKKERERFVFQVSGMMEPGSLHESQSITALLSVPLHKAHTALHFIICM